MSNYSFRCLHFKDCAIRKKIIIQEMRKKLFERVVFKGCTLENDALNELDTVEMF